MASDWMDDLIQQSNKRQSEASERRRQALAGQNKLLRLAAPIWQQIEEQLLNRVEAFNARVRSRCTIQIMPKPDDFTLKLKSGCIPYPFLVRFTPEAGALTYGTERLCVGKQGWLTIRVGEETPYTIERNTQLGKTVQVPFEALDELVLKDLFEQIIGSVP